MHCGIHVGDATTAKAVRKVLRVFHENKKQKGVDEMLYRLYSPIIWRCMSVANPIVRRNAASLFVDTFPLQDPENSMEDTDALLQKQFDQLMDLLADKDFNVRTIGVQGVCRVLGIYWELLPAATIKVMLDRLVNDLAFDSSSTMVRVAVMNGMVFVLENHLSHPLLKVKLPLLAPLIHDRAPQVQLALLDILLYVKKIRSIRFFDIVSVDQLLARLEVANPKVAIKVAAYTVKTALSIAAVVQDCKHRIE